jgi:hypothetical protein
MTVRIKAMPVVFLIPTLIGTASAWGAGPTLTPEQIQAAIQEGRKYKTADKFLEKGFKGKQVGLTGNTTVRFFGDWQAVAIESATAHQQMRELKVDEVQTTGLLHAYVEIHAAETWTFRSGNGKFQRSHLVLPIGERVIQPVKETVIKSEGSNKVLVGRGWVITLAFDFDVLPEDLRNPVEVIVIDGDGHKHQKKADLKGILNTD